MSQVITHLLKQYSKGNFDIPQRRTWAKNLRTTLARIDADLLKEYMEIDTDALPEDDLTRWTMDVYILLRVERDESDYLVLSDIAGVVFNMQMQTLHEYIRGYDGSATVKIDDLRYVDSWSYHSSKMHINDMPTFIARTRSLIALERSFYTWS